MSIGTVAQAHHHDPMTDIRFLHTQIVTLRQEIQEVRQQQNHTQEIMGQVLVTYAKCTDTLSEDIKSVQSDVMNTVKHSLATVRDECQMFTRQQLLIMQTMWTRRHTERMQEIELCNRLSGDVVEELDSVMDNFEQVVL